MPTHGTATKVQQNRLGGGDVENKVSYRLINLNTITGQDNPISDESANLDSNIAADFTGLGGSASRLSDLDTFESIQAEFDKIQGDGDNNVTGGESSLTVGGGQLVNQHGQNPITITTIPISSVGAVSLAGQTQVSSAQTLVSLNAQPVVTAASLHNSQVLATTQTVTSEGKTLQSVVKRPLVSASSGQVVTKVIITKNPNTNQPQAVSLALSQPSQTAEGVSIATIPQTVTVAHPGSLTPTKTITISQAGVLSPSKVFSTVTGTPTKQVVPANRIALSPIKSPAKVTMIPVSLAKSPQRIAPAPAPGHMVTMVAKSVVSPSLPTTTVTTSTAKPATITMSPSKVIIRQQAGGLGKPLTAKQVLPISATPNVQPMQVSGSRFQYVRLVTAPASQVQNSTGAKLAPAPLQAATVVPASTAMAPKQMKITVPVAPAQICVSEDFDIANSDDGLNGQTLLSFSWSRDHFSLCFQAQLSTGLPLSSIGAHGYNNSDSSMHPFFIAHGPAFKVGYETKPFNNTDIYPLLCHILNIKPAKHDGSLNNVRHILRPLSTMSEINITFTTYILAVVLAATLAGVFSVAACRTHRMHMRRHGIRMQMKNIPNSNHNHNHLDESKSKLLGESEEEEIP